MIVGAIISIVCLLAAPDFIAWKSKSELRQAATELTAQLYEARVLAQSRNSPITVTIDMNAGAVRTTLTNTATGIPIKVAQTSRVPHIVQLLQGPSPGWAAVATASVLFTSLGTRAGGPGPNLNQELALLSDKGLQYAIKVTPRGLPTWCPQSACP